MHRTSDPARGTESTSRAPVRGSRSAAEIAACRRREHARARRASVVRRGPASNGTRRPLRGELRCRRTVPGSRRDLCPPGADSDDAVNDVRPQSVRSSARRTRSEDSVAHGTRGPGTKYIAASSDADERVGIVVGARHGRRFPTLHADIDPLTTTTMGRHDQRRGMRSTTASSGLTTVGNMLHRRHGLVAAEPATVSSARTTFRSRPPTDHQQHITGVVTGHRRSPVLKQFQVHDIGRDGPISGATEVSEHVVRAPRSASDGTRRPSSGSWSRPRPAPAPPGPASGR